jgi:hypothetical protein
MRERTLIEAMKKKKKPAVREKSQTRVSGGG